ncbi:MtN21 [Canna indica]|uniref:WAT1-related protein n=1 Tax=Canna indica TaxID=4628 RepID=A0AAQ3KH93_9LILI|nr:MtN21 [Canna indica]
MASFLGDYKPFLAMLVVQCINSIMGIWAKSSFSQGMNPMIFVVYRQAIGTLALLPLSLFTRSGTMNQYLFYHGLNLSSPSMAAAMGNIVPALTFVIAASIGLEKVDHMSVRSMAKVLGTIVCVGGAISMTFYKGPRLYNSHEGFHGLMLMLLNSAGDHKWVLGSLFVLGSSFCWSSWLILQVPICRSHPDPLALSTWMCLFSTCQSAALTYFSQPNISIWKIHSAFQFWCCLYSGTFGSGASYYLQSWSVAVKGPLYSAMFNPLCTVITTILSSLLLHEELHLGSLVGAGAVISGLYVVLWGKAKDVAFNSNSQAAAEDELILVVDSKERERDSDMEKPLLDQLLDKENQMRN